MNVIYKEGPYHTRHDSNSNKITYNHSRILRVKGEDQEDLGLPLLHESVAEGALDALGIVGDVMLVKVDFAGAKEELASVTEGLGTGDTGADGVLGKLLVEHLNGELEALETVNLEGMLGLVNLIGLGLRLEVADILLHDHHCVRRSTREKRWWNEP
jgi:hypothetical protein